MDTVNLLVAVGALWVYPASRVLPESGAEAEDVDRSLAANHWLALPLLVISYKADDALK